MSIAEVLLFIATNSRACAACIEFKAHHRFPAQIIRLDTESAREHATNGSFFQITSVPTMVVIYNDGNTQMFVGSPKIIQWMTMIIKTEKEEPTASLNAYNPAGGNMYGPRPNPPRPFQDDYREPPPVKRMIVEEYGEEEYEEEEPEVEVKPPPKVQKKKPAPAVKSKKTKKKPPVRFEEEPEVEQEVEYFDPEEAPKPKSKKQPKIVSAPPKKQQPSRMNNLIEEARRMEQDRKSSLGYREEDLPKY